MIYIVGNSSLSFYIASCLQEADIDYTLASTKFIPLKKYTINIKEDGNFNKKKIELKTTNIIDKEPKLLIFCGHIQDAKRELIAINKSLLINTKILCLSEFETPELFTTLFNKEIEFGYVDGFLKLKEDNLTTYNKSLKLLLGKKTSKEFFIIFTQAKIAVEKKDDSFHCFWHWFSTYSISYLLSCAYKKPVFELLNSKVQRQEAEELCQEMAQTMKKNTKSGTASDLFAKIYKTPHNISYKYSDAQINFINNTINKYFATNNAFNKYIKIIYKNNVI